MLFFLSLIWGSSFILIKKALISFEPLQVGTARIAISFIAFIPLLITQWSSIPRNKWLPLIVVGFCGSALPAILYAIGQTHIPSGIAGVLNSMTPIFTLLLALVIFKQKFRNKQILGIVLGFSGTVVLFFIKEDGNEVFAYFYAFLIILATIFYGISANTVKTYLTDLKPLVISVVSFSIIGPLALCYLLTTDFIQTIGSHPQGIQSFSALIVLSLIGTFAANILFFKLIQITDAVFSTSVSFLIPFVALFWGFIDGEPLGLFHVLALVLILGGIFLIRKKEKR